MAWGQVRNSARMWRIGVCMGVNINAYPNNMLVHAILIGTFNQNTCVFVLSIDDIIWPFYRQLVREWELVEYIAWPVQSRC